MPRGLGHGAGIQAIDGHLGGSGDGGATRPACGLGVGAADHQAGVRGPGVGGGDGRRFVQGQVLCQQIQAGHGEGEEGFPPEGRIAVGIDRDLGGILRIAWRRVLDVVAGQILAGTPAVAAQQFAVPRHIEGIVVGHHVGEGEEFIVDIIQGGGAVILVGWTAIGGGMADDGLERPGGGTLECFGDDGHDIAGGQDVAQAAIGVGGLDRQYQASSLEDGILGQLGGELEGFAQLADLGDVGAAGEIRPA